MRITAAQRVAPPEPASAASTAPPADPPIDVYQDALWRLSASDAAPDEYHDADFPEGARCTRCGGLFVEGDTMEWEPLEDDDGWVTLVHPECPAEEGTVRNSILTDIPLLDPLTLAALEAAREPLPEDDDEPEPEPEPDDPPPPIRAAAVAAGIDADLAAALAAITESHRASTDAVVSLIASARTGTDGQEVARQALDLLRVFASRPSPSPMPPPDVHLHVPPQPVAVTVEGAQVEVHVPEQPAPVVHLNQEAARIDVHVPAQEAAPAPVVNVHVPAQEAPPPPAVHVHVPPAAPSAPKIVRSIEEPDGSRTLVVEDLADDPAE